MALFRFHRGGFIESMSTVIEVSDKEDLRSKLGLSTMDILDVVCFTQIDTRNGWKTCIVLVNDKPVGFTNEEI